MNENKKFKYNKIRKNNTLINFEETKECVLQYRGIVKENFQSPLFPTKESSDSLLGLYDEKNKVRKK